jgi:nucleoid DNA-binding protein
MTVIATQTGLSRKDVGNMFNTLGEMMGMDIGKKGPGTFVIPGMMKVTRVHKPATKARKGINPFTGEETTFKAKPARNVVKIRPLKNLKEKANH